MSVIKSIYTSEPSKQFLIDSRQYNRQYFHIYNSRYRALYDSLLSSCTRFWPAVPVSRISDLSPGVDTAIIGIIIRECSNRPSFLKAYVEDYEGGGFVPTPESLSYRQPSLATKSDRFCFEDPSGRAVLSLTPECGLVTGVVASLRGLEDPDTGSFVVSAILIPGLPPMPTSYKPPTPIPAPHGRHIVAVVCGLSFAATGRPTPSEPLVLTQNSSTPTHESNEEATLSRSFFRPGPIHHASDPAAGAVLLLQFLHGRLGPQSRALAAALRRIFVIGPFVAPTEHWYELRRVRIGALSGEVYSPSALKHCDAYLHALSQTAPLDVVPARHDPTSVFVPQQPIHPSLLPRTASVRSNILAPNPHITRLRPQPQGNEGPNTASLDCVTVLCMDATPVLDCVRWRGVFAPAIEPDTLMCNSDLGFRKGQDIPTSQSQEESELTALVRLVESSHPGHETCSSPSDASRPSTPIPSPASGSSPSHTDSSQGPQPCTRGQASGRASPSPRRSGDAPKETMCAPSPRRTRSAPRPCCRPFSRQAVRALPESTLCSDPALMLDTAIEMLRWRLMAPTAPDTLPVHPGAVIHKRQSQTPTSPRDEHTFARCSGTEEDLLVLETSPDILIVGGSEGFATHVVHPPLHRHDNTLGDPHAHGVTRVVIVPEFARLPGITLVDLSSPTFATRFIPFTQVTTHNASM